MTENALTSPVVITRTVFWLSLMMTMDIAVARGLGRLTVGGFVSGGGRENRPAGDADTSENTAEGGVRVAVEGIAYEPWNDAVIMLWELRAVARGLGGWSPKTGYGGAELVANGGMGITFIGLVPFNFAIEDAVLRGTNRGLFGKALMGTSHVLPIDHWLNAELEDGLYYLALSHGFRYHSLSGWTWALMPKFRLDKDGLIQVEARYLFGFWSGGRREHSGALIIDLPIGNIVVSFWGQPEYHILDRGRGEIFGWRAVVEVSVVVMD